MNDVTIPHAFVLRKTLCTTSSVSERGDMDSENHSVVDPVHWITLCENNSIKTENIDGYIIKFSLVTNIIFIQFYILASLKIKDIDFNHYSNSP